MDTSPTPWIAIVDDEAAVRRALQRLLRSVGLPTRAYAGGAELLAALRLAPADLPFCAVLDLHMPDLSGTELQARLVRLAPHAGVIFATGHHSAETQARALRCQPVAYLLKPMDEQQLLAAIAVAHAAWSAALEEGA